MQFVTASAGRATIAVTAASRAATATVMLMRAVSDRLRMSRARGGKRVRPVSAPFAETFTLPPGEHHRSVDLTICACPAGGKTLQRAGIWARRPARSGLAVCTARSPEGLGRGHSLARSRGGQASSALRIPRTAWPMRCSFSTRAKRTWPSPPGPKPTPGDTATLGLLDEQLRRTRPSPSPRRARGSAPRRTSCPSASRSPTRRGRGRRQSVSRRHW